MKKIILVVVGVLVLLALVWGGFKFLGKSPDEEESVGADVSSGNAAENTDAQQMEPDDPEAPDSGANVEESVSGSDAAAADEEEQTAEASEDGSAEDVPEETAFSDEGTLYTINTSAGSNLGMVPIVNGNAVVLMDGGSGMTYQGEYAPAEQSAFQSEVEEKSALASSEGKIGAGAFYQEAMMESFTFPEGVTAVEKFAFARSGLRSIAIPEGVTSIGYGAFYHCDSLTDVTIPDSVTTIEENAFAHTPWLENWMTGETETASEEAGESDGQNASGEDDFLIVGDGILLAYRGTDEDPQLPANVKSVAPGAFGR